MTANQTALVAQTESRTLLETLSPRYRTKARYSDDGQYEGEDVVSFDPAGLGAADLEKMRAEIDKALAPLSRDEIIQEVSLLRTVTRSREQSPMDTKAMLLIYAQDLADVPGPALKRAILEIRQTSTWFPTVAEIRARAESKCQRARVALTAINGTSVSRVVARVRQMATADEKRIRMLEQSQHWPDPRERGAVIIKAIPVHNPESAAFVEQAREGDVAHPSREDVT